MTPALAQAVAGPQVLMEKPPEGAKPEESKRRAHHRAAPSCCDTCIPIETGHFSHVGHLGPVLLSGGLQPITGGPVTAGGNFHTFYMPVKVDLWPHQRSGDRISSCLSSITGPTAVNVPGPNGETSASYGGIGDMTADGQIQPAAGRRLHAGSDRRGRGLPVSPPAMPRTSTRPLLGQDAIGTGSLTFTTGVNLLQMAETVPGVQQYLDEQPGNIYKMDLIPPVPSVPGNT